MFGVTGGNIGPGGVDGGNAIVTSIGIGTFSDSTVISTSLPFAFDFAVVVVVALAISVSDSAGGVAGATTRVVAAWA